MTPCIVFHIVHRNDEWDVFRGGMSEPVGRFKHKADAVQRGRDLALREEMAVLRVALTDGSIQSEFAYGRDPSEMEGVSSAGGFR
jgi:hypothetical protein